MGFIVYLRKKRWILSSFVVFALLLFLTGTLTSLRYVFYGRQKQLGKVGNTILTEAKYDQEKAQAGTEIHPTKIVKKMKQDTLIQQGLDYMDIQITDPYLKKAFDNYDKPIQEWLQQKHPALFTEISKSPDKADTFHKQIKEYEKQQKSDTGSFYQTRKKDIKEAVEKYHLAKLTPHHQHNTTSQAKSIDIQYRRLHISQLTEYTKPIDRNYNYQEIQPTITQQEKTQHFNQTYTDNPESFIRCHFTIVKSDLESKKKKTIQALQKNRTQIQQIIQNNKNDPKAKKQKLETLINKENSKTTQHTQNTTTKTWNKTKDTIPIHLQNLQVDQISHIMPINKNTFALYIIKEKTDDKITAWQLTKTIQIQKYNDPAQQNASQNAKKMQQEMQATLDQHQKTTPTKNQSQPQHILEQIKKIAHIDTQDLTKTMANKLDQQPLANHVFNNNPTPYKAFTLKVPQQQGTAYYVAYVEYKRKKNSYKDMEKDIEENLKKEKKRRQLEQQLTPQSTQTKNNTSYPIRQFQKKFGYSKFQQANNLNPTTANIGKNINCQGEIAKLIYQEKPVHIFYTKEHGKPTDNLIVLVKKSTTTTDHQPKQTKNNQTTHNQNTSETLDRYIEQYKNPNDIDSTHLLNAENNQY